MLNALYYPYADVTASNQLLLSSLYFDNIYVLEPNFFRAPHLGTSMNVPSSASMWPLVESEVVKPIGPDLLGLNTDFFGGPAVLDEDNVGLIKASIESDIKNQQLQEFTNERGIVAWEIPTGQQLFWNGLGILLELSNENVIHSIEIHADRADFYAEALGRSSFSLIPVKERVESRLRVPHSELEVRVPFLVAESLMITVSLLACKELGLVPITDSEIHHEFMMKKISNPLIRNTLRDGMQSLELGLSESALALKSMEIQLPNLAGLSAEKVLKLRERCKGSLKEFRVHMQKLRHSLEETIWSEEFEAELQKIIDTEIIPGTLELNASLTANAKDLGLKVMEDLAKLSPVPLLATLATGYPLELLLAASAGVVILKDYLEFLKKRGELKKNGLFFLVKLAG